MAESSDKPTIELMHQKLNAHFKQLENKRGENAVEEKALSVGLKEPRRNVKQCKGTCKNCGKYDHKAVNFPEKKSDIKTKDASTM